MDAALQSSLIQATINAITNRNFKIQGESYQIPVDRYCSTDQYEKEKEAIFQNLPIVVGATHRLDKAGDYFLHELTGKPIVVIKGADLQIRAFLNICRHRGVRLLEKEKGHISKNIVCPYHAWSYDTSGCLNRVFHPEAFNNVSAKTHSLIELGCLIKMGLIFVIPNPALKGKLNIEKYLAEAISMTSGFDLDDWVPVLPQVRTNSFNWKLGVEAGLEAYHFKVAHAETIGPYLFDCGGMPVSENELHLTYFIPKTNILKLKDQSLDGVDIRGYGNTLLHIFPNTTFLMMKDHVMVVTLFPKDEKTSISESFMLVPKPISSDDDQKTAELNLKIFWDAIEEDNQMTLRQQQSFNGHSDISMTVGGYGSLLFQFSELVQRAIDGEL